MMNIAFSRPNLSQIKVDETYLKNFNLALLNWELNRQEDRKNAPVKKEKRVTK